MPVAHAPGMTCPTPHLTLAGLACIGSLLAVLAGCSVGSGADASGTPGAGDSAAPPSPVTDDGGAPDAPPFTPEAGGSNDAAASSPDAPAPSLTPATFLTIGTSQYLSDGDGGALVATSSTAGASETFALTDLNGGSLTSGDPILLASGGSYLSAADGGGGALTFSATTPGSDETFLLVLVDGGSGPIAMGDSVALETKVTGNYVSAINGGGGQVLANAPWDRAWETYTFGLGATADGGSRPSTARQTVLAFLAGISGNHTAIGVEDKSSTSPEADSDTMASMAGNGQHPSFWSADWGFGGAAQPSAREDIVQEGIKQWGQGAIVQYIYHTCPLSWGSNEQGCDYSDGTDPINGSFGDLSDAQWKDLTTAGGMLNGVWLARLDTLATYFQELKAAGVAPLFRVLHEINGQWAWWQGRPGPTGSALLYQITHDYLVKTKGLDNIVWVWNVQDYSTLPSDVTVYTPGPSHFDVAALDIYDTGYTTTNYQAMTGASGGKPIGVGECQFLPSPSVLAAQPLWAYVAVWPDFLYSPYQTDNSSQIPALFSDSQVLTLSQMPGW